MDVKRGGKKYRKSAEKIEPSKKYGLNSAFQLIEETSFANFDESVDVAINLGVDVRQSDQQVRGAVALPHGSGKTVRILAFSKGDKAKEAEAAQADFVGAEDMVEKIAEGWMDFDKVIATPDMMPAISKVAKILGPRGLMPNPKIGTVTMDIGKAVAEQKKGKVSFRTDKAGIIHCMIGRKSLGAEKLRENFLSLFDSIRRMKPNTSKGVFLCKVTVSSTMGPPIALNVNELSKGE